MNITRSLDINPTLKRKSVLLLGPRQTGKSSYLKTHFPDALYIDLLLNENYSLFQKNLDSFRKRIEFYYKNSDKRVVIVDEIQKLPQLMDEVHYMIEKFKDIRFILTGSSARKLKTQNANLLGGRASLQLMFPFTYQEVKNYSDENIILKILTSGLIPSIFTSNNSYQDLVDYVGLYLKEEIKLEGLVRNLFTFSEFLDLVALSTTQQINYSSFSSDAQISPTTAKEYFQILQDTLVGVRVGPFNKTKKRKAVSSSKFYFFDVGIINALLKRKSVSEFTPEFGVLFEQYIYQELRAYIGLYQKEFELSYWRTTDKTEVDFVIYNTLKNVVAIEVKSSKKINIKDFIGLERLSTELTLKRKIIVSYLEKSRLEENGIEVINVYDFLDMLWSHKIISI